MRSVVRRIFHKMPDFMQSQIKKNFFYGFNFFRLAKFSITILFGKIVRVFFRPKLPDTKNVGFNIHLGCGAINHPDFINVDGVPFGHIHYVHRIDRLPMFKDGCADMVYASHCLEHFPYKNIQEVLNEWGRVLKTGGILRLSVPDIDKLIDIYKYHGNNPDVIVEQLMGGQNNKYNYHLVAFNKVNLTSALAKAGFCDIHEWLPGCDEKAVILDFSIYKKNVLGHEHEVSLNLQARKK